MTEIDHKKEMIIIEFKALSMCTFLLLNLARPAAEVNILNNVKKKKEMLKKSHTKKSQLLPFFESKFTFLFSHTVAQHTKKKKNLHIGSKCQKIILYEDV